jgi:hypothetical protein
VSANNGLVLVSGFCKEAKAIKPESVFLDVGVGSGRKKWHRKMLPGVSPGEYLKLMHCVTVGEARHYLVAVTSKNTIAIFKLWLYPTGRIELTQEAHRPFTFDKGMDRVIEDDDVVVSVENKTKQVLLHNKSKYYLIGFTDEPS